MVTIGKLSANALPLQGSELKAALLRGGTGSLCLKVVSTALSLTVAAVLARLLGAEGYGVYAYVMALVTILALPAQAGLPTLVVRETAKAHVAQRWGLMWGLWRWSSRLSLGLSLLLLGCGLVAVWLVGDRFTRQHVSTFYFGLLLVPLVALGNLRSAALRGLRRVLQGQLPETMFRPGLFLLIIATAHLVLPRKITPEVAMASHAAAAAMAFIWGAWFLYRARPPSMKSAPYALEYETHAWRKTIVPLALIAGIGMINAHADTLMLGWFRSAEEVGLYRVAASSAGLLGFGMTALNSVVAPHFARLYAQRNMAQLQQLVTRSAQVMVALALPVFIAFILAGEALLTLAFGNEFATAYIPLIILSFGHLFSVAVGSVGALLNMTGHERSTALGAVVAAGSNVILNAVLIPLLGVSGAALATAGSLVLWNLVLWRAARAQVGISCGLLGNPRYDLS